MEIKAQRGLGKQRMVLDGRTIMLYGAILFWIVTALPQVTGTHIHIGP